MTSEQKSKRVHVVFDGHALDVLAALQRSTGKNLTDIVRDAIGFYNWARMQVEDGKAIATVDHKTDRVREFIMPFAKSPAEKP